MPDDIQPLIQAFERHAAVVYVGAGASAPAELPGWRELLVRLLDACATPGSNHERRAFINNLIEKNDLLMAAELLQTGFHATAKGQLRKLLTEATEPTLIHRAIARLPFALALTTNFDRLLERAYPDAERPLTYLQSTEILARLKTREFAVIKTHGDIDDAASVVLTRTHVRNLEHLAQHSAFNRCISILLSLNTFLFVGSSLRDQDLLRLMDRARLEEGENFGPHYAILFDDETNEAYREFLLNEYRIHVIRCKAPPVEDNEKGKDAPHWKTQAVCSVLKHLSGEVASRQLPAPLRLAGGPTPFNLLDSVDDILRDIIKRTGSNRGQAAFVRLLRKVDDPAGSGRDQVEFVRDESYQALHVVHELARVSRTSRPPKHGFSLAEREASAREQLVDPDHPLGQLFLVGGEESTHRPVSFSPPPDSVEPFRLRGPEVASVLACPVFTEGQRVGVLAIGSDTADAYTSGHYSALREAARLAGAAFAAYRERLRCGDGVMPFLRDMRDFQKLMNLGWPLFRMKMCYLLYEVDYAAGIMRARFDRSQIPAISNAEPAGGVYRFNDRSFACQILHQREPAYIEDARQDLTSDRPRLARAGVEYFGITGPVYGTPLWVGGNISSVLVCWSRHAGAAEKMKPLLRRISRMAHLIVNDPERSENKSATGSRPHEFLKAGDKALYPISAADGAPIAAPDRKAWNQAVKDPHRRREMIYGLMDCLTDPSCRLARIRLWKTTDSDLNSKSRHFEIIHSLTIDKATYPGLAHRDAAAYIGLTTDNKDPYCRYTLNRAPENPHAVFQHTSMFGAPDQNCDLLHKDRNGSWLVAPIVYEKRVIGFISADNHYPHPPKGGKAGGKMEMREKKFSDREAAFQRLALDLVADLLQEIMEHETGIRSPNPKTTRP